MMVALLADNISKNINGIALVDVTQLVDDSVAFVVGDGCGGGQFRFGKAAHVRIEVFTPYSPDRIGESWRIRHKVHLAAVDVLLDVTRRQISRRAAVNDIFRHHRTQRKAHSWIGQVGQGERVGADKFRSPIDKDLTGRDAVHRGTSDGRHKHKILIHEAPGLKLRAQLRHVEQAHLYHAFD